MSANLWLKFSLQGGVVDSIFAMVTAEAPHGITVYLDFGRKGFATRGKAEEGRISYEEGIGGLRVWGVLLRRAKK
jgi:hypothetical protein